MSPKEITRLFVEAVEKINPKINAVIEVYNDRIEGIARAPAANVTDQPAISLPLGQSKLDLPIGVQFMARFGE